MNTLASLTSAQLKRAADIKDKITKLEKELGSILGVSASPAALPKKSKPAPVVKRKSKMSAAGRARIVAAQKARWANIKAAGKK